MLRKRYIIYGAFLCFGAEGIPVFVREVGCPRNLVILHHLTSWTVEDGSLE